MCGIIGFNFEDAALGKRMTDCVALRGPDGQGVFAGPEATLGNRRLAILDLSSAGHQPMVSDDGGTALVYNGEVYNFRKLRQELAAKGCRFKSESDTEVVLRGYEEWGERVAEKLEGMWAFALYDMRKNRLILSRDPFGIKPLFYYARGKMFVFASEIKAIRLFLEARGEKVRLSSKALESYFTFGYSIHPETIFEDIRKVSPGETLSLHLASGALSSRLAKFPNGDMKESDPRDFEKVMLQSVERHLASDVPVGLFLSGGTDSTLIALLLKKLGRRLSAFTVRMGKRHDADFAAKIAAFAGLPQAEIPLTEDALEEMYERAWRLLDEPIADTSLFPSLLVSKRAANDVKVVMTGEGGDELFFGYERYAAFPRFGRALPPSRLARFFDHMARPESKTFLRCGRPLARRLRLQNARRRNDLLGAYREFASLDADAAQKQFLDDVAESFAGQKDLPVSFFDEKFYLPNDLLYKTDFATMAYSLEGRVPFLDRSVREFAQGLPFSSRLRGSEGKFIIKEYLSWNLPPELIFRRKEGFSVPKDFGLLTRHEREVKEAAVFACDMRAPLRPAALWRLSSDHSYFAFLRERFPAFLFSLLAFYKVARKYPLAS